MADNVCPYLGSVDDPMSCTTHASEDNLCYATGEGEVVSRSHQKKYCLGGKLAMCTRFPADPALNMIREAADTMSPVRRDETEFEDELEHEAAVFAASAGIEIDEPDGVDEEYFDEEFDFEDAPAVAEKTPARTADDPIRFEAAPESTSTGSSDLGQENVSVGTGSDDFYFEDIEPETAVVSPMAATPRIPIDPEPPGEMGKTVSIPPVGTQSQQRPAFTSQETLAGQPLAGGEVQRPAADGTSHSPVDAHPADRMNGTIPISPDFGGASDSVYDPTLILPVIKPPVAPPLVEPTPKVRKQRGGIPEPALAHPANGAKAANGSAARKNVAGVDPNWIARHKASQAVLNQRTTLSNDAQGVNGAGAIPEPILRPAEIQGPVKPMIRQAGPAESTRERRPESNTGSRSRAYLYVSMLTTILSLLLICGGGAMVYHSLAASETEAGLSGVESPAGYVSMVLTTTPEAGSPIVPVEALPTAEERSADVPPTITPDEGVTESAPTTVASTEVAMAAADDDSTSTASGSSEPTAEVIVIGPSEAAEEATEEPTDEPAATATPRPTRTPTLTATSTPEDTATPTETATSTTTPEPTSSATPSRTATATATPTAESTATSANTATATATQTVEKKATSTKAAATATARPVSANATAGATPVEATEEMATISASTPTPAEATSTPSATATKQPTATPAATETKAPTLTPTALPTTEISYEPYAIEEGDSLYSVALAHDLELSTLVEANPELEGAILSIGQEIRIPVAGTPSAPTDTPVPAPTATSAPTETPVTTTPMKTVTIQPGDSLYVIASQNDISVDVLLQANPGLNPQTLQIGQAVNVPEPGTTLVPTPTVSPSPTATVLGPQVHVIESGDSLLGIANLYGVTVDDLMLANPDVDPVRMAIGQELRIPRDGQLPVQETGAETTPEAELVAPEHISAPSIGLDAEIVTIDSRKETQDGLELTRWDEPDNAAGFHSDSSFPGQDGNIVMSGYQNGSGEVFRDIVDFEKNAEITVNAGDNSYTYSVDQVLILPNKEITAEKQLLNEKWLEETADERLTLISYWPYENATHMVIVVAKPVLDS